MTITGLIIRMERKYGRTHAAHLAEARHDLWSRRANALTRADFTTTYRAFFWLTVTRALESRIIAGWSNTLQDHTTTEISA